MTGKYRLFSVLSALEWTAAVICLVYYAIGAMSGAFGVHIFFVWPLAAAVFGVSGGLTRLALHKGKGFRMMMGAVALFLCVMVASFGSFSVATMKVAGEEPPEKAEYLFLLGAAVKEDRPSRALQERIDASYRYLTENPETKVICTGGKDENDAVSEGACAASVLQSKGIAPERIFIEDQSTTTNENFEKALALIETEPKSIVICSNSYHLRRAKSLLSSKTDAAVFTLAASDDFLLPHYLLREYIIRFLHRDAE